MVEQLGDRQMDAVLNTIEAMVKRHVLPVRDIIKLQQETIKDLTLRVELLEAHVSKSEF